MLVCITAFIWEIMLATAYYIYNTVIKSILMHEITIWHTDLNMNESKTTCQNYKNESIKKLVKMQNKYLWVVVSIYKIMLTIVLETETYIFLLDLYLNIRLVSFHQQHKKSDMKEMIRKTCKKIWRYFYHNNVSRNFITNKKQI